MKFNLLLQIKVSIFFMSSLLFHVFSGFVSLCVPGRVQEIFRQGRAIVFPPGTDPGSVFGQSGRVQ